MKPPATKERRAADRSWLWSRSAKGLRILLWMDSRKVCFSVWLATVATILVWGNRIDGGHWITAVTLSAAVLGLGTVADRAAAIAERKIEVTNESPAAPQPPQP